MFLACCLMGLQVPVFVEQYGNTLKARTAESEVALAEFQDDADRYFEGDFSKLIAHYKSNGDEVIVAGGESIDSIYQRNLFLAKKLKEFESGTIPAYVQAVFKPAPDVETQVWEEYNYAVQVDPVSLGFGLTVGLLLTIFSEVSFRGCCAAPRRLFLARRQRRSLRAESS